MSDAADGLVTEPDDLLREADARRDERAWGAAAAAYAAYLRQRPDDWGIRVQYGHCVKEAGDLEAGLASYREAERLAPDDADLKMQIGHVLKRLNQPDAALASYSRVLELDPGHAEAAREAAAVEAARAAAVSAAATPVVPAPVPALPATAANVVAVVFDASDLIAYFRDNRAPTGIQRVQLNVIAGALTGPRSDLPIAVVAFDDTSGFWREVEREDFLILWQLSGTGADPLDPAWIAAVGTVTEALAAGRDFAFPRGASLVNLGTSWWIRDYFLRVRHVQRRFGVRYLPFVHDCIPLLVPEHCSAGLVREFARWLASLALHADGILANSKCTRTDVLALLGPLLPGRTLPATVIPLDADMRQGARPVAPAPGALDALPLDGPYVLFVGTIESRKNHLLVFNAWLTLLRKHGRVAVPRLVCVGKRGWLAGAAMNLLENSEALRDHVALLHDVPDAVLTALYERCRFTVYNSFYEGWGLPVTESLGYGKVPLIPQHSSLVEAGGEGAVFFAHQSEPDLVEKLWRLMSDDAWLAECEARIAERVRLRSWSDITAQLMSGVAALSGAPPVTLPERIRIAAGRYQPVQLIERGSAGLDMAVADVVRDGLGWHPLESWGAWTRPGRSRLRVPLPDAVAGERLRIYLELRAPPGGCKAALRVVSAPATGSVHITLDPDAHDTCVLEVAHPGAIVEIELDSGEGCALSAYNAGDARVVGVGLSGFMVSGADDLGARLGYMERARFRVMDLA